MRAQHRTIPGRPAKGRLLRSGAEKRPMDGKAHGGALLRNQIRFYSLSTGYAGVTGLSLAYYGSVWDSYSNPGKFSLPRLRSAILRPTCSVAEVSHGTLMW